MAKKKPVTTKLDATVKSTHRGSRHKDTLPERIKPYSQFRKEFEVGAMATIWLRGFDEKKASFFLKEVECVLLEASVNCFYYEDEDGRKQARPWWAVYNFEVEHTEEPIVTPPPGGDDQLPDEQGPGDPGGDVGDDPPERVSQEPADI